MSKNLIPVIPLLIFIAAVGMAVYFLVSEPSPQPPVEVSQVTAAPDPPTATMAAPSPTHTATMPPPSTPTPSPSDTPTSSPTATSLPSETPTPTVTPTTTLTPTATDTATIPATSIPSPTATLISLEPSDPLADAVITLNNGFVSLRRGPGPDYEVVGTLRKGDKLEVQQRLFDNDDWLKVSVNSDSGEGVTGWVTTDSTVVDINVELADVPPMYEFGPHLLTPKPFESRGVDGLIEFQWEAPPYPLTEYQYYSLLLVRDDLSPADACFHWQTKEPSLSLTPDNEGCTAGAYNWRVGIATDLNGGVGERNWRDDTEFDEANPIGIGIPHPGRPSGGGGGGTSGSSSGGSVDGG